MVPVIRNFVIGIIAITISILINFPSWSSSLEIPTEGHAISLKVLEKNVKDCRLNSELCEKIFQLFGIKKISGYIIDEKNRDLVLIGKTDNTTPTLYLDDFVIALRNAWLIYAPLRGNTYYYSPPNCSIDPEPNVLSELQQIGSKILGSLSQKRVQRALGEWHSLCHNPQKVRVMGIPFNTRFSKIMVEADYYMKRLVDGSVNLDIDGFMSLTEMTLNIIKGNIEREEPVSIPLQSMNRFWFFPGDNKFIEGKGILLIEKSAIRLLTEEEFLTERGRIAGSGKPDPLAQTFADSFTARYDQIAKIRSVYAELEALFRFVALAKVMKLKKALSETGTRLDYLFNRYPIKHTPVDHNLSGISNVKEFQHKKDVSGGYIISYLWLPSCGGVSMDIRIKENNITKDTTGRLLELRKTVLNARPSLDVVCWDFSLGKIMDLDIALGSRLKETEAMKDSFRKRLIIDLNISTKDMAPLI